MKTEDTVINIIIFEKSSWNDLDKLWIWIKTIAQKDISLADQHELDTRVLKKPSPIGLPAYYHVITTLLKIIQTMKFKIPQFNRIRFVLFAR